MKRIYLSLFFLLSSCYTFSQKEDFVWIFGSEYSDNYAYKDTIANKWFIDWIKKWGNTWGTSSIDFNNDPPLIAYKKEITMDFYETNGSICDSTGNLLLYSNGMQIIDGQHELIADSMAFNSFYKSFSEEINGVLYPHGVTVPQGLIILPNPAIQNEYFIIYNQIDLIISTNNLLYSKVVRNNNKTTLLFKDKPLGSGAFSTGLTACRHGNGRDWWVIAKENPNTMLIYLLDHSGLNLKAREKINGDLLTNNGQLYFSPDGKKLAMQCQTFRETQYSYMYLFDFDRCKGSLHQYYGDTLDVGLQTSISGLSFSSNSKYLYVAKTETIFQYDMDQSFPQRKVVATFDGFNYIYPEFPNGSEWPSNFGLLGLAPDGKIYVSTTTGSNRKMGVIAKPNNEGVACDVRQHSIHIPTSYDRTMPNFPNFRLGPIDNSLCDTLGIDNHPIAKFRYESNPAMYRRIEFFDLSYFRPETWAWDFGDGFTSDKQEPFHEFDINGTYNVCLTVSNENSSNTSCRWVTIGPSAVENNNLKMEKVVSVFPNPTEGEILLTLSDYIPEKGEVFFYNTEGKEVLKQRVYYGWNNIDLTTIPQGIYAYKVKDKNVTIGTGKLVKL